MNKRVLVTAIFCLATILAATNACASTQVDYAYDPNGSMISGDGLYYEYNDANQLVKVRKDSVSGTVVAEYVYDYNGQRIKKIENGVTTYYIGKYFEQQVGGDHPGKTDYYFANGERVAKKDSSGNLTYFHSDNLGSTEAMTDAAGNLVLSMKYYPFGELREDGDEKYGYNGKERDNQTDLNYYEARYYGPELKHFTQADDIMPELDNPQDLNRYSYVHNNPMTFMDPDGHKKKHHSKKEEKKLAKERAAKNAEKKHAKKQEEKERSRKNTEKKFAKKEREKERARVDYAKHHPGSVSASNNSNSSGGYPNNCMCVQPNNNASNSSAGPTNPPYSDNEGRDSLIGLIPYIGDAIDVFKLGYKIGEFTDGKITIKDFSVFDIPVIGGPIKEVNNWIAPPKAGEL